VAGPSGGADSIVVDSGGGAWGGTARDDEFEAEAAGDVGAAPAAALASLTPPYLTPVVGRCRLTLSNSC
jgi:hypothetical protein